MVTRTRRVLGALVSAAALSSAGLLLVGADSLLYGDPLFYPGDWWGLVYKVAGAAVVLAVFAIITSQVSTRWLFRGAVVGSVGIATVAAGLLDESLRDSNRTMGVTGVTLGVVVLSSWWASDRRRGLRPLSAHFILAGIVALLFVAVAARALGNFLDDPEPFSGCVTGTLAALRGLGGALVCLSMLVLLETCCWARRRAGEPLHAADGRVQASQ